jgi:hypothetical protein
LQPASPSCPALLHPRPRRCNTRFKDYERSPIGFGVVVFCIAKPHNRELFQRFYDGFAPWGEPNIPIDKGGCRQQRAAAGARASPAAPPLLRRGGCGCGGVARQRHQ